MLRNANPYLLLTAVQQLASTNSLTSADLEVALSSTDQRAIASTFALVRFYSWADTGINATANAQWLIDWVLKIVSLDQLEAAAIGISVSSPRNMMFMPTPTTDLPILSNATTLPQPKKSVLENQLIPAVRQKLKELVPEVNPKDVRWSTVDAICRAFNY